MSKNADRDLLWKWVIIGNSGVGKTSILSRLCNDEFSNSFISTIGIDFKIKKMQVGNKNITVQIWDTAGQERFGTITKSCYRGCNAVLLVYDVCSRRTFEDISKWLNEIQLHAGDTVCKLLLGNKSDLENSRTISMEEAQAVADKLDIPFMEVSAKTSKNIQRAFATLVELILGESIHETGSPNGANSGASSPNTPTPTQSPQPSKSWGWGFRSKSSSPEAQKTDGKTVASSSGSPSPTANPASRQPSAPENRENKPVASARGTGRPSPTPIPTDNQVSASHSSNEAQLTSQDELSAEQSDKTTPSPAPSGPNTGTLTRRKIIPAPELALGSNFSKVTSERFVLSRNSDPDIIKLSGLRNIGDGNSITNPNAKDANGNSLTFFEDEKNKSKCSC